MNHTKISNRELKKKFKKQYGGVYRFPKRLKDPLRVLLFLSFVAFAYSLVEGGVIIFNIIQHQLENPETYYPKYRQTSIWFWKTGTNSVYYHDPVGAMGMLSQSLMIFLTSFLAISLLPWHRTNAIYLRSFKDDIRSYPSREAIQLALGQKFRLSGIRDPKKRIHPLLQSMMGMYFVIKYAGPKYLNLEAAEDWKARLWRSLFDAEVVFVDLRDMTDYVLDEIELVFSHAGSYKLLFITDSEQQAIDTNERLLQRNSGYSIAPEQLIVMPYDDLDPVIFAQKIREQMAHIKPNSATSLLPDEEQAKSLFTTPFNDPVPFNRYWHGMIVGFRSLLSILGYFVPAIVFGAFVLGAVVAADILQVYLFMIVVVALAGFVYWHVYKQLVVEWNRYTQLKKVTSKSNSRGLLRLGSIGIIPILLAINFYVLTYLPTETNWQKRAMGLWFWQLSYQGVVKMQYLVHDNFHPAKPLDQILSEAIGDYQERYDYPDDEHLWPHDDDRRSVDIEMNKPGSSTSMYSKLSNLYLVNLDDLVGGRDALANEFPVNEKTVSYKYRDLGFDFGYSLLLGTPGADGIRFTGDDLQFSFVILWNKKEQSIYDMPVTSNLETRFRNYIVGFSGNSKHPYKDYFSLECGLAQLVLSYICGSGSRDGVIPFDIQLPNGNNIEEELSQRIDMHHQLLMYRQDESMLSAWRPDAWRGLGLTKTLYAFPFVPLTPLVDGKYSDMTGQQLCLEYTTGLKAQNKSLLTWCLGIGNLLDTFLEYQNPDVYFEEMYNLKRRSIKRSNLPDVDALFE